MAVKERVAYCCLKAIRRRCESGRLIYVKIIPEPQNESRGCDAFSAPQVCEAYRSGESHALPRPCFGK